MLDLRLFNQESLSSMVTFQMTIHVSSIAMTDRPLFHGLIDGFFCDSFNDGTKSKEGIGATLDNDQFNLGQARAGFKGAADQEAFTV